MDCSVCLESIQGNAKSLLCGHIFCRRCVSTLIVNAGGRSYSVSISCPECRRPSRSGSGDIRDVFVRASSGDDAGTPGSDRSTENEQEYSQVEQDHNVDIDVDTVNANFGIPRGESPVPTDMFYVSPFSGPSGDNERMTEHERTELRTALLLSQQEHGHNSHHDHGDHAHSDVHRESFLLPGPPEFLPAHLNRPDAHESRRHSADYIQAQNHAHNPYPNHAHPAEADAALQAARRRIRNLEEDLISAQENWVHAQSLVNRAQRELAKKDEKIRELEAAMARAHESEWWRAVMAHRSASDPAPVSARESYWPHSPPSPVYPHTPWGRSAHPPPVIPRGYTL